MLSPRGKIKTKFEDGVLHVPAEVENLGKSRHHIDVPGKYKIPFRIDMTARVKYYQLNQIASQLTLYINNGSVYFNGGHTSVTDILTGDDVPPSFIDYNDIPTEEYVDISITCGSEMIWVVVNGKFCFASDKIKHAIDDTADISICGGTATRVSFKSFAVTEYEDDEPDVPAELTNLPDLPPFEMFVKGLPLAIQDEMFKLDEFLLVDMKLGMKFRRSINKKGHLTYEATCGFRFEIREHGAGLNFMTAWVKTEKKPDYTNEIILKLAETAPEFAEKMFEKVHGCEVHLRGCARTVTYELMGKRKLSCCGRMNIKMDANGFADLKGFIAAASEVVKVRK